MEQKVLNSIPEHILQRKERMRTCLTYLKEEGKVPSLKELADRLSLPPGSVRSAFHDSSRFLSEKFIDSFLSVFPGTFSKAWVMEGVGEMLLAQTPQPYTAKSSKEGATRSERFTYIMKQEGENYQTLAQKLSGISQTTLYRISKRQSIPHEKTCDKLLEAYPYYSRLWLLHGSGPIYNAQWNDAIPNIDDSKREYLRSNATFYDNVHQMYVPFVPIHAYAGKLNSYEDEVFLESLEHKPVLADQKYFGHYLLFEVKGDSMTDGSMNSILDKDILLCRSIKPEYWLSKLHTHHWPYFLFVTVSEGLVLKSIKEQNIDKGYFVLSSLNPMFEDIKIEMNDIREIYNVVQLVSRKFKR